MFSDQLCHILISSRDQHLITLFIGVFGQRSDHIIGFHIVYYDQRQTLGPDNTMQWFNLNSEVIWHRRTVRLIFGIDIITEGFALGIENHSD